MIVNTPQPPYYAVIFSSVLTNNKLGYAEMAKKMVSLASKQPGFLGVEAVRDGLGITVSYWTDLNSIKLWKENIEHTKAREKGREVWYRSFKARISKVERDYGFEKND